MPYLLDADVFIQAKRLHYGFDVCPAFWDWLVRENGRGRVFSIEKVGDELTPVEDELASWAHARGEGFFLRPDQPFLEAYREVATWASSAGFDQGAVATFLQAADSYLVAHARRLGWVVVTHEVPSQTIRKVEIPVACIALGVKVITPFAMLRMEQARFVLAPPSARGSNEGGT